MGRNVNYPSHSYSVVVDDAAQLPRQFSPKQATRLNIGAAFSAGPCQCCGKPINRHAWFASAAGRIVECSETSQ